MKEITITPVRYFDDNYAYVVHHTRFDLTAVIDCGDSGPVLDFLDRKHWRPDLLLLTHSHYDHAGDVEGLKTEFPETVVIKPAGETRIEGADREITDGDTVTFGDYRFTVVSTPAHTRYCTCYVLQDHLFVGDVLFSMGCGRLFEGSAADLVAVMDKLRTFPDQTRIYFGHEYTLENFDFARAVEPDNRDLVAYERVVSEKLDQDGLTTPTTLAWEKKINPFLRIDQPAVIAYLDPDRRLTRTMRMALLRSRKDDF